VNDKSKEEIRAQLALHAGDDVFKDLRAFANAVLFSPSVVNWQKAKREQRVSERLSA
jgi:hypothetical protein